MSEYPPGSLTLLECLVLGSSYLAVCVADNPELAACCLLLLIMNTGDQVLELRTMIVSPQDCVTLEITNNS